MSDSLSRTAGSGSRSVHWAQTAAHHSLHVGCSWCFSDCGKRTVLRCRGRHGPDAHAGSWCGWSGYSLSNLCTSSSSSSYWRAASSPCPGS
uniref:Uncharacterized protein n=1 Tax=Anguilla anguilla TaxID=7936 RepID=A0A0E9PWI2_ANGAN